MDKKIIIQQGDFAKFRINITHIGFSQAANDFFVTLTWGMANKSLTIQKSEMITDSGNYYFTFDSSEMTGKLMAECHYMVPDASFTSGYREEVDYQIIGFVCSDPCPTFPVKCLCVDKNQNVHYTREDVRFNIIYGSGATYTDASFTASSTTVLGTYNFNVATAASYVFFIVPVAVTISEAEMSGFEFPLNAAVQQVINGVTYNVYQSVNTYDAGEIEIDIVK